MPILTLPSETLWAMAAVLPANRNASDAMRLLRMMSPPRDPECESVQFWWVASSRQPFHIVSFRKTRVDARRSAQLIANSLCAFSNRDFMTPNPNFTWDDLQYFLAVARTGQLSTAARHLRTSHATVS